VQKPIHTKLFQDEAVLQQLVEKIVIPNLTFREADEVKFEEDPHEYMVTEVEGSDSESRRRCAQDLLRSMCRNLVESTTTICKVHVHKLLTEYQTNPNEKWAAKDAAVREITFGVLLVRHRPYLIAVLFFLQIHLMMSIAIRRENMTGVAEINSSVDLMDFFTTQILPELQDANHQHRPVVKVAAIKFICTFRKQFPKQYCVQLLPLLIAHLSSPIVVVHTFAAYTIERMMMTREEETKAAKIGAAEVAPVLEPLFMGLFDIVDNTDLDENAYVMKCVMRTLTTIRRDVAPVTEVVIRHLTAALQRVCSNPRSPDFNHSLFESLAILVKSVCSQNAASVQVFEGFLIAPFWTILEKDISEFTPYVYQIFAQLLEFRPPGQGLTDFYKQLFTLLIVPTNWDNRGNIPALARLVSAYIAKAPTELASYNTAILGIFQKLLAAKPTEAQAIQILNVFVSHVDSAIVVTFLDEIFRLLLTRLQKSRTPKYVGLFSSFLGLLASKYGGAAVYQHMESVQPGMTAIMADTFWAESIKSRPPVQSMDAKVQAIGMTRFLFEPLQDGYFFDVNAAVWTKMVLAGVALLSSPSFAAQAVTAGLDDADIVDMSYDSTFSELKFSRSAPVDLCPDRPNPVADFCQGLMQLSQQRRGQIGPLLQQAAQDPKTSQNLQILLDAHNVQIA
jgi:exportin-2 (importin alpha re-exporter)